MLAIQVNVCYILKHLEDRKTLFVHIHIFITLDVTSSSFSTCTEELDLRFVLLCIVRMASQLYNKYEQRTLSYSMSFYYCIQRKHTAAVKMALSLM